MKAHIENFAGLHTGETNPPFVTSRIAQNINRRRIRGMLEIEQGYASKGLPTLPVPINGSLSSYKDIHSFVASTPEGEKTFYVVVSTYTKATTGWSGSDVVSMGIFITPWYDGAAWQAGSWQEVTEFYKMKLHATTPFPGGDLTEIDLQVSPAWNGALQVADYFKGWAAVFGGDFTSKEENFLHITSSSNGVIHFFGSTANLATRAAGNELWLFRNFFNKSLPSTVTSRLRSLFDELRFTSGGAATDLNIAAFYKNKTMVWSDVRKGLYADPAVLDISDRALYVSDPSIINESTDPLDPGVYALKASVVLDDNQESELRGMLGTVTGTSLVETLTEQSLANDTSYGAVYASDGKIYTMNGGSLIRVDPATNLVTDSLSLGVDGVGAICEAGTNIAVLVYIVNAWAIKIISQSSFTVTATSFVPGTAPAALNLHSIVSDGTKVYVGNFDSGSYNIVAFTISGSTWGSPSANISLFDYLAYSNGNLYAIQQGASSVVTRVTASSLALNGTVVVGNTDVLFSEPVANSTNLFLSDTGGKLWRIALSTFTTAVNSFTGSTAYPGMSSLALNSTYLFARSGEKLYLLDVTGTTALAFLSLVGDAPASAGGWLVSDGTDGVWFIYLATGNWDIASFEVATGGTSVLTVGTPQKITYKLLLSPSLLPERSKAIRVYISKDGADYFQMHEISILTGGDAVTGPIFDSTTKHHYYRLTTAKTILKADFTGAVNLAITNLGRSVDDDGVIQYSSAVTSGNSTVAVGVRLDGNLLRNKLMRSSIGGGVPMFDVFPNDVSTVIDVDYNDGDYVVGVGVSSGNVLVLKNNSLVLLVPNAQDGFDKVLVSQGIGIKGLRTLQSYNESLYWLDDGGVVEFSSSNGPRIISGAINDQIKALGDKASAFAILDTEEFLYRLYVGGVVFVYDLIDGEWTKETFPAGTAAYAMAFDAGTQGYMMLLAISGAFDVFVPLAGGLDSGAGIAWAYETARLESQEQGEAFDIVPHGVAVQYETNTSFTVEIFKDGSGSALVTHTAGSSRQAITLYAPLGVRAKYLTVKFSGTKANITHYVRIKRLTLYYTVVPAFGELGGGV